MKFRLNYDDRLCFLCALIHEFDANLFLNALRILLFIVLCVMRAAHIIIYFLYIYRARVWGYYVINHRGIRGFVVIVPTRMRLPGSGRRDL